MKHYILTFIFWSFMSYAVFVTIHNMKHFYYTHGVFGALICLLITVIVNVMGYFVALKSLQILEIIYKQAKELVKSLNKQIIK